MSVLKFLGSRIQQCILICNWFGVFGEVKEEFWSVRNGWLSISLCTLIAGFNYLDERLLCQAVIFDFKNESIPFSGLIFNSHHRFEIAHLNNSLVKNGLQLVVPCFARYFELEHSTTANQLYPIIEMSYNNRIIAENKNSFILKTTNRGKEKNWYLLATELQWSK